MITERDREEVRVALRQHAVDTTEATAPEQVLMVTHHPLVAVDCPWLDGDRIQEPERLLEWLLDVTNTKLAAVAFGHAHQAVEHIYPVGQKRIPVWGAPSTCFQFLPKSPTFALDDKKPGFRWLKLAENGTISTSLGRATQYALNLKPI